MCSVLCHGTCHQGTLSAGHHCCHHPWNLWLLLPNHGSHKSLPTYLSQEELSSSNQIVDHNERRLPPILDSQGHEFISKWVHASQPLRASVRLDSEQTTHQTGHLLMWFLSRLLTRVCHLAVRSLSSCTLMCRTWAGKQASLSKGILSFPAQQVLCF